MKERHAVYERRLQGLPRPWTDDPILHTWRFCNPYREHDRVTRWITENWRTPHHDDPDLWFAMVIARFVNWPDTLAELGYPVPWDPEHFLVVMNARKGHGEVSFGAAYTISNLGSTAPKAVHLVQEVFAPLWRDREKLQPRYGDSLASFSSRLLSYRGMGGFMAAQVIADLKYVEPLRSATDWDTFALSGPGSREGLNRILGRDPDAHWNEEHWHRELMKFCAVISPLFAEVGLKLSHAQDLQNMLCEFAKYEKAREGKPLKRRYFCSENQAKQLTFDSAFGA
jgi:hypothetical protein